VRITIEADCRRGLRIIEEIPDIALCKIEGYNGIGKTNAIKLLRLCTGEQPFENDEGSWRTFRSQLVRARVHVTGLRDAQEIEWLLEPNRWPEVVEPLGDLLGTVNVSGRDARQRDIPEILTIYHVIAAETPASVLAGRAHLAHKQVSDWFTTPGRQRQDDIEDRLFELQKTVADCLPSQLQQDLTVAQEAKRAAEGLETELNGARHQAHLLDKAVEVADRLDQVRGRGPEMDAKLRELRDQLEGLDDNKRELDQQVREASARQHRDEQAEREFENAQKYLIRQDKSLRDARDALERLAATAGIDPRRDQVATARAALVAKLNDLVRLLPQVNATPMLVSLLSDLAERLAEAEQHELGEAVLLEPEPGYEAWTVSGLRTALSRRMTELSQRTPTADAEQLTAEIAEIRDRLDALAQTDQAFADLEQSQVNFARAETRLRMAASDLPEQTVRTLDELMNARNRLDQESQSVQADLSRLSHARDLLGGGMTEDALAAELVKLCREAGVDAARVHRRREETRAQLEDLVRREAQVAQQAERALRVADQRAAEIARVVRQISSSDQTAWLRQALPSISTLAELSHAEQAKALERLNSKIDSARTALREAFSAIEGIGAALGTLNARLLYPNQPPTTESAWNTASRLWLAEEVRQWFDNDTIRNALFDGASDIRLDPQQLTLSWTVDGERQERPLSAFSSGQQAFAYTQAQVAQLDRQGRSAANRLIALDEFGSYLDAERMADLVVYLAERQNTISHDQVVVIVPLEASLRDMADGSETSAGRFHDLRRRGYFAEALQP
jgi:hypothetical protein